jgi:hypothetical protein
MKPTAILSIDPGASGGVVELWPNGKLEAITMPDDVELCDLIHEFKGNARLNDYRPVCYLELVGGYIAGAKLPGSAMFNFGDASKPTSFARRRGKWASRAFVASRRPTASGHSRSTPRGSFPRSNRR